MDNIALLLDAGLIQMGNFADKDEIIGIHFAFDMLPSYPTLLKTLANYLGEKIIKNQASYDYLLCRHDSLPLALLISQNLNIPLVYEVKASTPVMRFVGAFDIGHPTCLINYLPENVNTFINEAKTVGLDVTQVAGIVGQNDKALCLFSEEEIRNRLYH